MRKGMLAASALVVLLGVVAAAALAPTPAPEEGDSAERAVAVETAPLEVGSLVASRRFPASLEAAAEYTVAPRVAGRVQAVHVDIGDVVERGDLLVALDDAEFRQELAATRADLQVAEAEREQAASALALAERRLARVQRLEADGIAAASELEDAEAEVDAQRSALAVAEARIARARSARETAALQLADTRITADWSGEDGPRVVGERMVDAGDTVAANTPLLRILDTRELRAVIQVPQDLYGMLSVGQAAEVQAAAMRAPRFNAAISRIAPSFDPASRQARVELRVDNAQGLLAPGMYLQVALEARRVDERPIVPAAALVERNGRTGFFTVDEESGRARFVPAEVLLRAGELAALSLEEEAPETVVVLGQDQLRDGAAVTRAGGAPA
ncbi:efflux RND transporter periplasmic adaptor subunit [Algiphilus aromaticivorans]|uniref:efflux RND transporter periplasmic adaptor subunit n=1 Tax=Algiphilus aromaticivorans TaxID=382454 RepID=UPI0005C1E0B7|nr:efflux RND transporter periplasmic adaptor subunit [Algiphilus aromaticivorans]